MSIQFIYRDIVSHVNEEEKRTSSPQLKLHEDGIFVISLALLEYSQGKEHLEAGNNGASHKSTSQSSPKCRNQSSQFSKNKTAKGCGPGSCSNCGCPGNKASRIEAE